MLKNNLLSCTYHNRLKIKAAGYHAHMQNSLKLCHDGQSYCIQLAWDTSPATV